ncbi:MAG: ABC transporter substrate-binding protein [Myxococcales bacterium]|nr:ABC transporter substrate-binding protein [Myxococcales bacterium]
MSACSRNLAPLYGLAAAAGFTLGACSLIVDFTECTSDAQCNVDGAADWMCLDGKCVPPEGSTGSPSGEPPASSSSGDAPPTTEPGETTTTGDTTAQVTITTTDDSSTGTTDNTTGPSGCTLNSECIADAGDGWLCIDGACVNALTAECTSLVMPSGHDPDKVVLVGSIIPSSDPYAPLTLPLQNALQLAIGDYNKTTDLPGGYRIAWVTCDDQGKLQRALDAASHLTGTLKVQAIVGPIFSEQVLAVAEQVTIPAGVFLISPTATARDITKLDDGGLVWRTITSDAYQSNAIADRVLDLTPKVEKLALVHKDDAYGNGIASDVVARLMVPLGQGLAVHPYPDPTTIPPDDLPATYGAVIAQAYGAMGEEHPDTIVLAGTTEVSSFVHGVLLLWSSENPPIPLPRFIVSHGAVPSMEDTVKSDNVPDPLKQPLMSVLEGTAPVIFDPQNFASFNARYKVTFNETDAITASSLSYDAGMLVMFAMAAVPMGEAITGAKIAANIEKLQDPAGTKVSFGDVMGLTLTFIKTAHNALVTGQTVDLKGVSGELQFDLATGEPRTNIIGWGLEPKMGDPNTPLLKQKREYKLDPAPLETGQWMDL